MCSGIFCDPTYEEDTLSLLVAKSFCGEMAYPSFQVINKSQRLKYTANIFIFDEYRYLNEGKKGNKLVKDVMMHVMSSVRKT